MLTKEFKQLLKEFKMKQEGSNMEALGLSLPVVILTVFVLFRFSKALSSVAGVVDDKISAVAVEIKASTVKDLAEIEITDDEIKKATSNITTLKTVKF